MNSKIDGKKVEGCRIDDHARLEKQLKDITASHEKELEKKEKNNI